MFGFTIWLVIGGIVGWLASVVTRTDNQQLILANIVLGVIGSYLGGALLAPKLGTASGFAYPIALCGALLLLAACHLIKRARQG